MRSKIKGYRRKDENVLVARLPLPPNALCLQCGTEGPQVRHHISDDKGIIYIWNVCTKCNHQLKQQSLTINPLWIVNNFHNHNSSCAICGASSKLVKHHYIEGNNVFVLRICHTCNSLLPTYGFNENLNIINHIKNTPVVKRIRKIYKVALNDDYCPECQSTNPTKAGFNWRNREKIQRYRCSDCGRVFTPENKETENG